MSANDLLIGLSSSRTARTKKNINYKIIAYGIDLLIGLTILPILVHGFNKEVYGAWLIVGSFVSWLKLANGGIALGLKNRLAEAVALKELDKARKLVSTSYVLLILIGIMLTLAMIPLIRLDWYSILAISTQGVNNLQYVIFLTVSVFAMNFSAKLITSVLDGIQRNYHVDVMRVIERILVLAGIFVLTKSGYRSLMGIAIVYSGVPYILWLVISFVVYKSSLKGLRPHYKYIDLAVLPELWGISILFMAILVSRIVIFSTDRLIISHLFGAAEVVPYHIVNRYYTIVLGIATALFSPMWSAYTEANKKNDIVWIRKTIKKGRSVAIILIVITMIMYLVQNNIIKMWIGGNTVIETRMSLVMMISVCLQVWGYPYMMYINGVGKVKLQTLSYMIGALFNIPLSILFAKYFNMGVSGVILATICCTLYIPFISPTHYRKLMKGSADGVWDK